MSSPSEVMRSDLRMSPSSEQLYAYDYYRHHQHSSNESSSSYAATSGFQGHYQTLYDYVSSSPQQSQHYDGNTSVDQSWKWNSQVYEEEDVNNWAFILGNASNDQISIHPSDTEISQERSLASNMLPSLTNTTGSQSPKSNFLSSQHSPHTSVELDQDDKEEASEEDEMISESRDADGKKKIQRRQGVTCDQCRSKHVRCIAREEDQGMTQKSEEGEQQQQRSRCERCHEKNLDCTRNYSPPSRRYPRPSRTGKRIEHARMIHGTLSDQTISHSSVRSSRLSPEMLIQARPKLFSSSNPIADAPIASRVMAGSVSLRLLTCFFATAHMQMPIVDFHNFSARYNFSQGNCRIMSIMANGGDATKEIPSAKQSAPGLHSPFWPPNVKTKASRNSALSTPGSSEALIAVMHAWAALYTDIPIAFGGSHTLMLSRDDLGSLDLERMEASQGVQRDTQTRPPGEYIMGANGKLRRAKRKSGVACDTCRLRRLRCDKLERPEGLGCSRCEDKRIVCTDEYIQFKKRKAESTTSTLTNIKRGQEEEAEEILEGEVGSAPSIAKDVVDCNTKVNSLHQTSWINQGLPLSGQFHFGKSREALAFGKSRQPFFQALLEKAINLVVKHQLMLQPSVEGIQALMLLAQIVDLAKHRKGDIFAEAAANHIASLGLESNYEVDENDRKAVEQILGHMQRRRLWCCVWTRDAIVSGLYRKSPRFMAERAFSIRASRSASGADRRESLQQAASSRIDSQSGLQSNDNASETSGQVMKEGGGNADLNGEMGLSFSILALMQVGALSRFMSRHVDNATLSIEYGNVDATSIYEMRKMTKACQALWKSIDSLLSFFDQCSLTARHNMDQLQPFQPLGWIATIKIAGAMLDLATFRNLAERLQRANLIYSSSDQHQMLLHHLEQQRQHPLVDLKLIVEESKKRTLISCRRIAKLVEFLLDKNVFQTSGIILRQLLSVTQFLVKMPCEVDILPSTHPSMTSDLPFSLELTQRQVIDPREIFSATNTMSSSSMIQTHDDPPPPRQGHIPEFIFSTQLEPFNSIQKKREVNNCLEALAQMGYAWPTMDVEIAHLEKMMEENLL